MERLSFLLVHMCKYIMIPLYLITVYMKLECVLEYTGVNNVKKLILPNASLHTLIFSGGDAAELEITSFVSEALYF